MLTRDDILTLIPHQGVSCLLDRATHWDATQLTAQILCHNDPANPYRIADHLPPITGVEIAMQAAALHGALTAHEARQGWLTSVRDIHIHCDRLDIPHWDRLTITVTQKHQSHNGMIYDFSLLSPSTTLLLSGTGTVMLPTG
ncbi:MULTISPECIES: phosphotransferase [Bombella]|uniref:Phosphotransferase n=1 Tax=Bombella pollinis TaxID=2967337 RepID=A0ABT3WJ53_9PROT|nr:MULTISPECIES: phosphotransferase [Bombella]MCT6855182.1 phosphotransferase [Bombella apis]MCX5619006.1 phosphotransferase [Bombella pollinis]MUG89471.1 phosphotransferase [Bombella sp. ESL0385]